MGSRLNKPIASASLLLVLAGCQFDSAESVAGIELQMNEVERNTAVAALSLPSGAELVGLAQQRSHPRLMVDGNFDRLRELHRSGRFSAFLRERADALVARNGQGQRVVPLLEYPAGGLLGTAREFMDRIYALVITHKISGEDAYVDRDRPGLQLGFISNVA